MSHRSFLLVFLSCLGAGFQVNGETVLNARQNMLKHDFWVNKDLEWFESNIPIIDSPDVELDKTYYYRWELVTRHIVYSNPNTGYVFTEFANRPFWSGA